MKIYTFVFSITLLLSATLLFSIQPMFSKMLLPMLGGTPQVWNTAMMFFQGILLGGYAYAHITSRFLTPHLQAILHIALLALFAVILPIAIPAGWEPSMESDPMLWQLSVMVLVVGGPFFVISGSAPMLQYWFSNTNHKDAHNPYFLYGASNLGSMAALLSYPTLIEPLWSTGEQSQYWSLGYFTLIILTTICAVLTWKSKKSQSVETEEFFGHVDNKRRLKWIVLSFIPSSLMLGVTTYITTDIASVPLLWILPFALYVSTFIIVFARTQLLSENKIMILSGISVILLLIQMISLRELVAQYPFILLAVHMMTFFFVALACHKNLADSKPPARALTEFYFFMSLGGVLGGVFNAIIAPNFFLFPIEYALALAAALLMRYSNIKDFNPNQIKNISPGHVLTVIATALIAYAGFFLIGNDKDLALWICTVIVAGALIFTLKEQWLFGFTAGAVILVSPIASSVSILDKSIVIHHDRNFFGVHKIIESEGERVFMSGVTNHGTQPLKEEDKLKRISYYSEHSPLTEAIGFFDQKEGPQHFGVLGLGIGVMACYQKDGRSFDFYEIDKDVAKIAENRNYFTYLSDCGSPYDIIIGDGRLEIEKQPDQSYDAIITDVFSSDNIPVHIITQEAIKIYLDKIKENGLLVIHISNNYVDLEPVIHKIAKNLNIPAYAKLMHKRFPIEGSDILSYPSHYVVLSHNPDVIKYLENHGWTKTLPREGVRAWSDKFSNIISVLGNHTAAVRSSKESAMREEEKEPKSE